MKPTYAIPFTAALTVVLSQNFNGGTFTVSGSTVTAGGSNAGTFTIGSSTVTVGGGTTSSADDATVTASGKSSDNDGGDDADDDTSSTESEDSGDSGGNSSNTASPNSSSSGGYSALNGFTSTYSGAPITLAFGSSTVTLGSSSRPSVGFAGWSYNATVTASTSTTTVGGADTTSDDNGGSATATPSGPSTSLGIITDTPGSSSAGAIKSVSTVLMFLGAAITCLL